MIFDTAMLPFISLIVIPLCGWLFRQLTRLETESREQESKIASIETWLQNHTDHMARKTELTTLDTKLDSIDGRLERLEDTVDRLRNGSFKH